MTRTAGFVVGLVSLTLVTAASGSERYDPRLRFRTISTTRFEIHFHQGEEALAQRLAGIAEDVAGRLDRTLGPANGRVQVILVDQNDLANGWATPLPYNTIEISAAAPTPDSIIGNVDDWLRLVFTHEYTHIVHLSRAGGWIGGLRRVFGRLPILFPNLFEPIWQVEGIATWQESAQTGAGRVEAGDFRLMLERAAGEKRLEPLDRAGSRLVDWPSGNTPYLYGGYFHQYLADKYGQDALKRLTDETARRVPYLGPRAFKQVFGKSLGQLWKDFETSIASSNVSASTAERLTRHGFAVSGPRFVDNNHVLYSLADPHGFPSLRELDLTSRRSRAVASRYLGDQVSVTSRAAIFNQMEIVRNVGLQSDLYALNLANGGVRRVTYGARAADPDVSPDGSTIVFTVQRADRRELAIAPLAPAFQWTPRALVSTSDVDLSSPRWSPDGKRVAAERRPRGGASEIVVVDAASGAVQVLVATGRNAGPTWSPDGSTILFAGSTGRGPFQIFSVPAAGGAIRKLDGVGESGQSPAVSPEGRSLVFVGYTGDGFDLFRQSLETARWREAVSAAEPAARSTTTPATSPMPPREYSPWSTSLPRFWTLTIESDAGETVFGGATGSVDALGRHGWGVEAGWASGRGRPDWQVGYAYDRWRPTLFAVAADDTDPWRGGERRTVEAEAGMLLTTRRVRWSQAVLTEFHGSSETFSCESGSPACVAADGLRVRRQSIRTGLSIDSSRQFGYSISPEEGGRVTATLESSRSGLLEGASSLSATVDARRYVRAWPRHSVIAVRGAAAGSWGDEAIRRVFSASGTDPKPGGFRFGSDAIGLIRGVDEDRQFGFRAAVVNLDYRLPIVHLERGIGTVPVFLKAIHAAMFVDAGHAWSDRFHSSDIRYSVGAELSADTILGYVAPVTFAVGGAWRDGPDSTDRGFAAFARVGRAF